MSQFRVKGRHSERRAIAFASRFLLSCAKRDQVLDWIEDGPHAPIPRRPAAAAFLGGFTAAEGSFVASRDGRRFTFSVGLGATDAGMCELFREHLGAGRIQYSKRRQASYDDEAAFVVGALRDLVETVVPFMDAYLPPSHKREQYLAWRGELLDYWEHGARRRRQCMEPGCTLPRRARGLCRHHYFQRYRR